MAKLQRILIFSLTYEPYVGGAEIALKEITDRIDQDAISFDMVTMRFDSALPEIEQVGNVRVHRIGLHEESPQVSEAVSRKLTIGKLLFPFISAWHAHRLHREEPYDALWVMMANHAGFGGLLFKLLHPKIPMVLTLQDGQSLDEVMKKHPALKIFYRLYRAIYTHADVVQVISTFLGDLARNVGVTAPIVVIPNGVDIKRFSKRHSETQLAKLRERLGMKGSKRYLVTTSRLVLSRGVADIIRALEYMPSHIELLVIGDGHEREELEQIATEGQVGERVHFLGHIAHAELPKYLQVANIFVRPSRVEGFGNSFVEAMAAGIPVIATPVGGIVDFLYDPEQTPGKDPTGLFCHVGDPQGLAFAVRKLLEGPELVAILTRNASKLVAERYTWDLVAQRMEHEIFLPLIDSDVASIDAEGKGR